MCGLNLEISHSTAQLSPYFKASVGSPPQFPLTDSSNKRSHCFAPLSGLCPLLLNCDQWLQMMNQSRPPSFLLPQSHTLSAPSAFSQITLKLKKCYLTAYFIFRVSEMKIGSFRVKKKDRVVHSRSLEFLVKYQHFLAMISWVPIHWCP